jgi:hypothetical protein
MSSMARELGRALDRSWWLSDAGLQPDEWQKRAMRSTGKRKIWNVHRQGGKSATAAGLALANAMEEGRLDQRQLAH